MRLKHPTVTAVADFLRRQELQPSGIVAVSGGPDSVALLRALLACRRGPADRLVVAHLNHQLRGDESNADEAFVRDLCNSLDLEFIGERIDVTTAAAGENLEATARWLRYDWLSRCAARAGLPWVATGHTANDQAETLLHRLLRGAGLRGLRGIAARRSLQDGVELVRPLLAVTREAVMDYLTSLGQPAREDRSNLDLRLTRNRIRHELLPHLAERYNPSVVQSLCRLAEQAEEAFAEAEAEARRLLVEAELPRAGPMLVFDGAKLAAVPRHRLREALRLVFEREGWPVSGMGYDHWERLASVASGEASAVELPDGVRGCCRGRVFQLGRVP